MIATRQSLADAVPKPAGEEGEAKTRAWASRGGPSNGKSKQIRRKA
jgi:hypothetical protein